MQLPRFPKTFETGFFIFLVTFWVVSFLAERSTLGRVILGYRSELYPMSTFAVYTGPKQKNVSVFKFQVIKNKGDAPIEIDAYDMFYPVQPPDLDDEIATRQLYSIIDSFRNHCPKNRGTGFGKCNDNPSETYVLQKDIGDMFLRSLQHHLGLSKPPYALSLMQHRLTYNPDTFQVLRKWDRYYITFYPQQDAGNPDGWTGHKPETIESGDTGEDDDAEDG